MADENPKTFQRTEPALHNRKKCFDSGLDTLSASHFELGVLSTSLAMSFAVIELDRAQGLAW